MIQKEALEAQVSEDLMQRGQNSTRGDCGNYASQEMGGTLLPPAGSIIGDVSSVVKGSVGLGNAFASLLG